MKKINTQIGGTLFTVFMVACGTPQRMAHKPEGSPKIEPTRSVMFIHGMFMTPACWDDWQARFKKSGYTVSAPAWPLHDTPIAEQRQKHPNPALGKLTLTEVVDYYRQILKDKKEKHILVGHSMGGLVVQHLLADGLGSAGIVIDSAPPKQAIPLLPPWSMIKANWAVISPFANGDEAHIFDLEGFQYAFVNTQAEAEQKAVFEKYTVPESRRVGRGADSKEGKIEFEKKKAPLLFIAGEKDNIVPASINRRNYKEYLENPSLTEFYEFPNRNHWIIGAPGWEEVADFALNWIKENQ